MPVYQINVWVCEVCNRVGKTAAETFPYSDPVVVPPDHEDWEYIGERGAELLACPSCQQAATSKGD